VRHAANELNWQIEDICNEGLELKQKLVREFEDADLRTYQLCFAIKTQPKTGLTGSIILKKGKNCLYDILHTQDFNPNSKDYVIYLRQIKPAELSKHLVGLCAEFYMSQSSYMPQTTVMEEAGPKLQETEIYQCNNCLTRYDKHYGDFINNISKDVEFTTLSDYCCPVCEAPKEDFSLVEIKG
jgi:rubredoxin